MLKKIRGRLSVWAGIASGALTKYKLRLAKSGTGVNKYLWLIFVILLAGNVVAFDYYQARLTRFYLQVSQVNAVRMMNAVRMNGDTDISEARYNQLNTTIDRLEAKIDGLQAKIDGLEEKVNQITTKTDILASKLDKPGPPTSLAPPPRRCTGIFCLSQ